LVELDENDEVLQMSLVVLTFEEVVTAERILAHVGCVVLTGQVALTIPLKEPSHSRVMFVPVEIHDRVKFSTTSTVHVAFTY
jgi:hypothetical protein